MMTFHFEGSALASISNRHGQRVQVIVPCATEAPLGLMQYCSSCSEYWPADAEFFRITVANGIRRLSLTCRACQQEAQSSQGQLFVEQAA